MACPQARRLERADQPAFLALIGERLGESSREVDPVAEDLRGDGRFGLYLGRRSSLFHVKHQ